MTIKAWIERRWDSGQQRLWWRLVCPSHSHLDGMLLSDGTYADAVRVASRYALDRKEKNLSPLDLFLPEKNNVPS